MKSIVEEASSVIKAIEKGWVQAGKPREFTVKVYEEGLKNFIGMSVEPAKIGIFFEEKSTQKTATPPIHKRERPPTPHAHQQAPAPKRDTPDHQASTVHTTAKRLETPETRVQRTRPHRRATEQDQSEKNIASENNASRVLWSPEMIAAAQQWLETTLHHMGKADKTFTIETKKYHIIVTFNRIVCEDKEQERALFRSFAHLMVQALRNKFKKGLRGFRVVLNSGPATADA